MNTLKILHQIKNGELFIDEAIDNTMQEEQIIGCETWLIVELSHAEGFRVNRKSKFVDFTQGWTNYVQIFFHKPKGVFVAECVKNGQVQDYLESKLHYANCFPRLEAYQYLLGDIQDYYGEDKHFVLYS